VDVDLVVSCAWRGFRSLCYVYGGVQGELTAVR
jgi:hypothetical protein